MALKCLIMREMPFRGRIKKNVALRMDPAHKKEMSKVFDLLESLGMLKI